MAIGERSCLSREPSADEWAEMYSLAGKQAIVGICFFAVQILEARKQTSFLPVSLKMQWLGMALHIQGQNELLNIRCVELQEQLQGDGVNCCILKGQGIARLYSNNINAHFQSFIGLSLLRQPGDIDVFVDCSLEKSLKYLRKKSVCCTEWGYVHSHPKFFDDVEVEWHYRVGAYRNLIRNHIFQKFIDQNKDDFFGNQVLLSKNEKIAVPSLWINIIFLAHHMFRHMLTEGLGLRQVMDYYFVLQDARDRLSIDQRSKIVEAFKQFGMDRFVRGLMWCISEVFVGEEELNSKSQDWMICEPDEKEGRYILEEIIQSGNFGHFDYRFGKHFGSKLFKIISATRRSIHLAPHYPTEALWSPIYYVWHFFWKRLILPRKKRQECVL